MYSVTRNFQLTRSHLQNTNFSIYEGLLAYMGTFHLCQQRFNKSCLLNSTMPLHPKPIVCVHRTSKQMLQIIYFF